MAKKILIILIILLILVSGTLAVYNLFFKKEALLITEPEKDLPVQKKPTALSPAVKIKAISQGPVLGPTIAGQKIKYYLAENGNVFQSNFDGSNLERLTSDVLQGLKQILWSPDKTKVIGVFSAAGEEEIKKYFYNHQTKQSALLNQNIQWLNWSKTEDKIAYWYFNPQTEDNFISSANPDGSNWKNIFKIRMKDLIVEWPAKELISVRTKPSGLAPSDLFALNLLTSDFKKILGDIYGLTLIWSPAGEKILFSETNNNGQNLKLKIADKNGKILKALDILTLPEKCVFSQDERFIFCAAPRAIPGQAVLPDDYYKGTFSAADDFYKINLETNQKTPLIEPAQIETEYDANQLLLSPQEDYLFFVNKKDGLLYSLKL